jgi:Fe2+ or Zn2+ uptake regulation protein
MSLNEVVTADRRLVLLRLLEQAPGFSANHSILHSALAEFGHTPSRDVVLTDLAWLAEQGLVSTRTALEGKVVVATVTDRGCDVAHARATVPGVKRPSPGQFDGS